MRSVSLQGPTPDAAIPQGIAGNAVGSSRITIRKLPYAGVAELADALDLGSSAERCVGSSPTIRTKGLIHGLPFNYHLFGDVPQSMWLAAIDLIKIN